MNTALIASFCILIIISFLAAFYYLIVILPVRREQKDYLRGKETYGRKTEKN